MAKAEVVVHVEYHVLFLPFATKRQCGSAVLVTILGVPVYKRVANVKSLFGLRWGSNVA